MKKKKSIIYACVGAVVIIGFAISYFVEWPVDYNNASGDIAKSSHFSRKTADGGASNMQELIQNDEDYKNGIVTAYVVMKTRAEQFNSLVDMSFEVASGIKELESVLKDMKEVQPMIKNVCSSMEVAGKDINSVLGGETADDLEQNTSNAALAYNTLQKQNKLADQFIEVVDKYINSGHGNDRIKFVRDQWVDYQQMTASLNNDDALAQELNKKGYLLSEGKRAAALSSFSEANQMVSMVVSSLASICDVSNSLANTLSHAENLSGPLQALIRLNMNAVQGTQEAVGQGAMKAVQGTQEAVGQGVMKAVQGAQEAVGQGAMKAVQGAQEAVGQGAIKAVQGAQEAVGQGAMKAQAGASQSLEAGVLNASALVVSSLAGVGMLQNMQNIQNSFQNVTMNLQQNDVLGMARQVRQSGDFIDALVRPEPSF